MAKILLELDGLNPDGLLSYGQDVLDGSVGNSNFASVTAVLTVFQGDHYQYGLLAGIVDALEGQIADAIIARDACRPRLEGSFSAYASASQGVVAGDPVLLTAAGWKLQAERQGPQPLAQLTSFAASSGDEPGEVHAQWDREERAGSYQMQRTLTPEIEASWVDIAVPLPTRSRQEIPAQPSGTRQWYRARGVGGATGYGPWSDPDSTMVP